MKKKFSKILGVGLTLALLCSLLMTAAPVSALSIPAVTLATGTSTISNSNANYTTTFELGKELAGATTFRMPDLGDTVTITGHATIADSGTITVLTGSVTATPANGATVAAAGAVVAITPASGAVAWTTTGAVADTIAVVDTTGLDTTTVKVTNTGGPVTLPVGQGAEGITAAVGGNFILPDYDEVSVTGDLFTITDHATVADSGTITVTAGSVTATPVGTATVAGGAVLVAATITPTSGAVAWTTPGNGAGDIAVEANVDGTTGSWTQIAGPVTVVPTEANELITTVASGDSITITFPVGTTIKSPFGTGNISLPDIGDFVTITDAGNDSGVINITTGTATLTGTGTYLINGVAALATVIGPGQATWSTPAGTGTIKILAATTAVTGSWTATTGTAAMTATDTAPVNIVIPAATIGGGPGWIGGAYVNLPAVVGGVTWAANATSRTITATLGLITDAIGETADVRINLVNCIQNPATAGTAYTLTVKTSQETTAVTSAAYTITDPTILPLPGVVMRYNSAGILMAQTSSIQTAINAASNGESIMVGAGTYDEDITITKSITVTGDAATTIIMDTNKNNIGGMVTISFRKTALLPGVVFDGFTVMGDLGGANALSITGIGVTVQKCIFTKPGTAATAVAQTMVTVNPAASAAIYGNTITDCTFDTTLGAKTDTGINVQAGFGENTTVSGCTFSVDGSDTAIAIADGTVLKPVKVTNVTISGASGNGVVVTTAGTVASITDSTLSNLKRALSVTAGTVTVTGSTIDTCGLAATTTVAAQAAIIVNSTAGLSITSSTISNSPNEIIQVTANSNLVNMMFNSLTDNTLGIDNNDAAANTLNATHNWWGVDTGPATGMNVAASTTTGLINATAHLGGVATGSFTNTVAAVSLLTKTTVGVDVIPNAALGAGDIIGVANYSANPQDATPKPALDGGFYDVYAAFTTAAPTSVLIKFYNADITANTTIYVWGTLAGGWQKVTAANQGVNLFEGFAYANILATGTPTIAGLAGTPFALCEVPTTTLATAPVIISPTGGERDVPLTPTFSWTQIAAAAGYYFELADNANFVAPLVKLDGDFGRLITTAYAYVTKLPYSKAYYWRVKAVSGTIEAGNLKESAWTSGVFITMDEPVEPTPPIVIEEAPTLPDITIEQPDITITSPDIIVPLPDVVETPITPSWIYVIIGVGAVLVIALLVLIVRTRRVA